MESRKLTFLQEAFPGINEQQESDEWEDDEDDDGDEDDMSQRGSEMGLDDTPMQDDQEHVSSARPRFPNAGLSMWLTLITRSLYIQI